MPYRGLVLSLFPSIGMLDCGFEEEGFCIVRGPDPLWGGDVRRFHPPPRVFDGIIGGDPCQSHSSLANLVRAKGLEPRFPDLTLEFQRGVEEAKPDWFLRENTPKAPDIKPEGYDVRTFMLDHSHLDSGDGTGHEQMRRRRFWFGVRDGKAPELRRWIDFALFELPDADLMPSVVAGHDHAPGQRDRLKAQAVAADSRAVPVRYGGSGKVKVTAVGGHDGTADAIGQYRKLKQSPVTGRHDGAVGSVEKDYSPPRRTLAEMLELQGFPPDWLDHQPWTMQAKRQMVGNGVPLPMSRALARAVVKALEKEHDHAEP